MAKEFVIINIDSGDMLFLGNQRNHPPVLEIGIAEEHSIFDEIPHYEYGDEEFRSPNSGRAWLGDFIRKAGHKLNFFLSHSRGCRLIVLDTDEFIEILTDLSSEFPDEYIGLNGQDYPKAEFYERRLRHKKSARFVSDEAREIHAERTLHYKNEIKNILKKNISKAKDANSSALNLETGGLHPNPVFTPWDDD